jgi:phage tail tape-measure protein
MSLFSAFTQELLKISSIGGTVSRAAGAVKGAIQSEARHGVNAVRALSSPVANAGKGWSGPGGWMGGGRLTRHLPVGPKGLTVGFGALGAPEALRKEDPTGKNRSRSERMGRWAGSNAGGLIGAPHGYVGSMITGYVGEAAGAMAGKTVERVKRPLTLRRAPLATPQHQDPPIAVQVPANNGMLQG